MIRHWMAIVAAGALLTGCGGSSGAGAEKPAPKPTARAYTLPELAAALPEKDDVPRATKAVPQCPEIKTTCDTSKGIMAQKSVKVELRPTPSELSPVEQERAAQAPGIGEFVQVSLVQHPSVAEAAAEIASARAANAKDEGPLNIKPKKLDGDDYSPGLTGTSRADDESISGWKGVITARRIVLSSPAGLSSRPILDAVLTVRRGSTVITGVVAIYQGEHDTDAATDLLAGVVEDTIDRLG